MNLRTLTIGIAALATLAPLGPARAEPRVQHGDYVAGALGDAELEICEDDSPAAMNVDQVCFDVSGGQRYKVEIDDAVNGSAVGYLWTFRNAAGNCVGDPSDPLAACPNSGLTCGTQILAAPGGAVQLTILLDGPVFGPLDCTVDGPGDSLGFATQGTVTATRQ
jgi:hypothetical protein